MWVLTRTKHIVWSSLKLALCLELEPTDSTADFQKQIFFSLHAHTYFLTYVDSFPIDDDRGMCIVFELDEGEDL